MEGEPKMPHRTHKRGRNMKQVLLMVFLAIFTTELSAACMLEGTEYPAGTIKGPVICGSDGYWRPK